MGMFLSPPSKESARTRSGYRATTRVTSRALQERLDALTRGRLQRGGVEQIVAKAEALRPAPIREQMARAGREGGQGQRQPPRPGEGQGGQG